MENVNEKILADYRLIVARLDIMKGEITELERSNSKMRNAFLELLDQYNDLRERSGLDYYSTGTDYDWCEKAGILD